MWMEEVRDFLERHILNDVTHINKYKALLCLIYIIYKKMRPLFK